MTGYVCITFDNGYLTQKNIAQELANRGMRATFYVNTAYILWDYGNELVPSDLLWFIDLGHEVGGHSHEHTNGFLQPNTVGGPYNDGRMLTDSDIINQVSLNKQYLDAWGVTAKQGGKVNFAYPSGSRNAHTDALIGNLGFRTLRSAYCGVNYSDVNPHNSNGSYLTSLPIVQVPPSFVGDMGQLMNPADGSLYTTGLSEDYMLQETLNRVDEIANSNGFMFMTFHYDMLDPILPASFDVFLDKLVQRGVTTLTVNQAIDFNLPPVCPDGQYWDGAQCVCPVGTHWNGTQCVPDVTKIHFANMDWTIRDGDWSTS